MSEPTKQAPDYYRGAQGKYFAPMNSHGYTSVAMLPMLVGRKWDEVALGMVHALRPSMIRVTTGLETMDAQVWRVTVTVDDNSVIQSVRQEVEVGLPAGIAHGMALRQAIEQEPA